MLPERRTDINKRRKPLLNHFKIIMKVLNVNVFSTFKGVESNNSDAMNKHYHTITHGCNGASITIEWHQKIASTLRLSI